jgi:hypothetical protein
MRPATAPDTIVAAVAAKATWKSQSTCGLSAPASGVGGVAEEAAGERVARIHDPVADHVEQDHADAEIHHVLAQDVHCVLRLVEARLEHREAGLHEQHEDGRDEEDHVVDRVRQLRRRRAFVLRQRR